jgi:hypothetical protein
MHRNQMHACALGLRQNCGILATVRFQDALSRPALVILLREDAAHGQISAMTARGKGDDEMTRDRRATCAARLLMAGAGGILAFAAPLPASAQDADYLAELKTCRSIEDEDDRLECYDAKVGAMVSATDAGDVRIVDREDVRRTRRQLFGFTVPDLDILEGDEQDKEASEQLETTVTSARQMTNKAWRFTTAENAVWEISNAPARLRSINAGDKVIFKEASLGFYFIRINGQMGVKGKRIQ